MQREGGGTSYWSTYEGDSRDAVVGGMLGLPYVPGEGSLAPYRPAAVDVTTPAGNRVV